MNVFLKKLSHAALLLACGATLSLYADSSHHKNVLYGQWPVIGQNYANTQVNDKAHTINRQNVGSLVQGLDIQVAGAGVASQPTYADGVIYFADSRGTVHAVDAMTGTTLWQTNMPNNNFLTTPTLTEDTLYIASTSSFTAPLNASAMAFNRQTGALIWSTPLYETGEFANEYPGNVTAVEDILIVPVSTAVFNTQFQGRILGFNRFTGERLWTVATTSDQFQANPQYGPGAGVFSTGAVDLKRQLYFVGTGQTISGVNSPLSDSLLAIDYRKGKLVWSYQYETNDVWTPFDANVARPAGTYDLDVAVPPNLFTVKIRGESIDCVGAGSKGGKYKIFTRSQPSHHNVRPLVAMQLDPGSSEATIHSTPVVHDGILYIASVAIPGTPYRLSNDTVYIPLVSPNEDLFTLFDVASMKTMAIDLKKLIKRGHTDGTIPSSAVRWIVYSKGTQGRNPFAYANGVLYQTSQTGFLRALNPKDGSELFYTIVDPQPGRPGIIASGATVVDGRVYVSYGFDPAGFGGVNGGVKVYQLP